MRFCPTTKNDKKNFFRGTNAFFCFVMFQVQKNPLSGGLVSVAQFALPSRAYHNSIIYWLTFQVKSVAICAKFVTHWRV